MSGLGPLRGHEEVRAGLARAARSGDLPGSLLIHGPVGIGKQRLALWLAQMLLCENLGPEPCGECHACRMSLRLEHPDLHWFFPIERPRGGGSPEKLAEGMEEKRAARLQEIRQQPLQPVTPSEQPIGFYVQQMQALRRIAACRPAMGSRKVFVVGDAEALVPQEASPDAANVLLKLLEEPPADTTIMLTASDPDALLPTIRSRLLPVRLRPLADDVVAAFLLEQRATSDVEAARLARLAQGSIGRALGFLTSDDVPGPLETLRTEARALLEAAAATLPAARLGAALRAAPAGARGRFSNVLEFLAIWVRDLAAVAAGADETIVNADALPELRALAGRLPDPAAAAPQALRLVDDARTLAYGNVNPQMILANLLRRLAETFSSQGVASAP